MARVTIRNFDDDVKRRRTVRAADGQTAAVACATVAPIAARTVTNFDGCGLRVISPWNDQ